MLGNYFAISLRIVADPYHLSEKIGEAAFLFWKKAILYHKLKRTNTYENIDKAA